MPPKQTIKDCAEKPPPGSGHLPASSSSFPSLSVVLYYGVNWVSVVADAPITISQCTPLVPVKRRREPALDERKQQALREESNEIVAGQLPRLSVATTRDALHAAFSSGDVQQQPKKAELRGERYFIASVWGLLYDTSYTVHVTPALTGTSAAGRDVLELAVTTSPFQMVLDLRLECPHVLECGSLLHHPELVECVKAQGESSLLFYLPPNLLDAHSALPFMHAFWYHGLFTLPETVPISPSATMLFFLLPNGAERYVLDLAADMPRKSTDTLCVADQEATAAEVGAALPAPAVRRPSFPWRQHSRVRRVIRSGAYSVVVRCDAEGVMACLRRACDYHSRQHASTWLSEEFIRLMGSCCAAASLSSVAGVAQAACGVRLVCVELLEEASGSVVAGCCGMAIGCAYHDYTMYTLRHSADSLGTFTTKLIGEALQACGYELWYWGFRVAYMEDYEKHFGAMNMQRGVFYERWCALRDVPPPCTLEAFLRENRGMVPYTTAHDTAPS